MTDQITDHLEAYFGKISGLSSLSGGNIGSVSTFKYQGEQFVLKTSPSSESRGMLQAEVKGLQILSENSTFLIPAIILDKTDNIQPFFVMSYIDPGSPKKNFAQDFAEKLHKLHLTTQDKFGLNSDNYIATLKQENTNSLSWAEFYAEMRLEKMIKKARDKNLLSQNHINAFTKLYTRLDNIFPIEKPALLHGDLWSGNYLISTDHSPALIDPAIYYGHREMDLGMMLLFGGFDETIFFHYAEIANLDKAWRNRVPYTQLYPLLVHLVLFGSSYLSRIETIIRPFK